ncbi:Slp family lipoprotein [Metallibacterium sp.]|jgi:outer membrane lipoprotein|uniref:Slp family lipoprotein n=1 Tax=Metallibacterium sp. TaxID=2940281 RepID=UPI00263875CE|nr:Slp family lipoprotein [Metallibacterium sp.]
MRRLPRLLSLTLLSLSAALLLAACAPAPIFKPGSNIANVPPETVAQAPERYIGRAVIWGGQVVAVQNMPDTTEVQILGYPLDSSQRPLPNSPAGGRFIAIMKGYVEPLNYPAGALVTLTGHVEGVRVGSVGDASYAFPLVRVDAVHVWTAAELRSDKPHFSFGLGVGVGIIR